MTATDLTAPAAPGADPTRSGLRRAMAGGVVAPAALVLAYCTEELLRHGPLLRLDTVVETAVPRHGGLRGLVSAVTDLGVFALLAVGVLALAGWSARRLRDPRPLLVAAYAVLLTGASTGLLKLVFGRARPPLQVDALHTADMAFPSGHTTASVTLWGTAVLLLWPALVTRRRRAAAVLLAGGTAVAVGLSRLYLGVHWASDVLAGWALGVMLLCAVVHAHHALGAPRHPALRRLVQTALRWTSPDEVARGQTAPLTHAEPTTRSHQ